MVDALDSKSSFWEFESLQGYMAKWQSGDAEVCKTFYVGSIPALASTIKDNKRKFFSTQITLLITKIL